jgi:hypothetical protein
VRRTVSPRKFACQTFSLSEDMSHTPGLCPDEPLFYVTGGQTCRGANMRHKLKKMTRSPALHDTGTPIARVAAMARGLSLTRNRCICAVSATERRAEVRLTGCRRERFSRAKVAPPWCRGVRKNLDSLCLSAVNSPSRSRARIGKRKRLVPRGKLELRASSHEIVTARCLSTKIGTAVTATARSKDSSERVECCRNRLAFRLYHPNRLHRPRGFE